MKKIFLLFLLLIACIPSYAQVYPGTGSNEDLWQSEEPFNTDDEFLYNNDESEFRQFFEKDKNDVFINEYEIKLMQEQERKKIENKQKSEAIYQQKLAERKKKEDEFKSFVYEEYLFQNVLFGIGSGALIGGLLSKTFATNLRQNLQYLGTSIFIGAVIGIFVSSKEVYFYEVPPDVVMGKYNPGLPAINPDDTRQNQFTGFNPSIAFHYRF